MLRSLCKFCYACAKVTLCPTPSCCGGVCEDTQAGGGACAPGLKWLNGNLQGFSRGVLVRIKCRNLCIARVSIMPGGGGLFWLLHLVAEAWSLAVAGDMLQVMQKQSRSGTQLRFRLCTELGGCHVTDADSDTVTARGLCSATAGSLHIKIFTLKMHFTGTLFWDVATKRCCRVWVVVA